MSLEVLMMPPRRRHLERLYRTKSYPSGRYGRKEVPPEDKEEGEWCLVGPGGVLHRLPKTMIFLGREECDIEVQADSVDKRHAVITFDHYLRRFKIKDLSTTYGTYVNDTRIPEQEYMTLEKNDTLFLGNDDSVMFTMERYPEVELNGTSHEDEVEEEESYSHNHGNEDLPAWATGNVAVSPSSSQDLISPIKECKGCIVEQHIEHTCGGETPEEEPEHHDLGHSFSHDNIASFGLGCNTWPKKRYRTRKVAVMEVFDMDNQASRDVDSLIDPPSHIPNRVLRGTGAPMNILPDELATVKKGTPLYGQPEWWGEEDADLSSEKLKTNGVSMEQSKSRGGDADSSIVEDQVSVSEKSVDKKSDKQSDKQSAESSDKQSDKPKTGASDPDNVPNAKPQTSVPELGATNMAFTIDFGEDVSGKGGKTLQELVPSKIRKSFRERKDRQEKAQSLGSGSLLSKLGSSKEKVGDTPSTSSKSLGRAVSEGREISPTHQCKLDDIWNSGAPMTTTPPESAASRRLAMARQKSSSHSQELDEDIVESSYAKPTKSSAVKRRPHTSTQSKPKSVIRARKAVSQEVLASSTQYTNDNASYLIEKMFQNNSTGSVDSLKPRNNRNSITEYDMYSEAIKFDTTSKAKSESQDLSSSMQGVVERESGGLVDRETRDRKTRSREISLVVAEKPQMEVGKIKDNKVDEEDKVSEAGTYTIEGEKESKAADEARKNIDKVFGVDQLSLTGSSQQSDMNLKSPKSEELHMSLQSINDELEELEKLEKLRRQRPMIDSLEGELGSIEGSEMLDSEENPSSAVPSDAPAWVTQWAALTNQKSQNHSADMDLSSPGSSISDEKDGKSSRTNGLSRKRPGTGRRLPTIPPGATSPTLSDNSTTKESPAASKCDLTVNGTASQMLQQTPKQRSVKISSHVAARYQDTDSESVSLTKYDDSMLDSAPNTGGRSKRSSNGSVASLDTDVLLKDTATVMAAIETRTSSKPKSSGSPQQRLFERTEKKPSENLLDQSSSLFTDICGDSVVLDVSQDGESDTSSVVACVNGDDDYVKPSYYKSPRDVLGKGRLKLTESLPSKPSVQLTGAKSKKSESVKERKRSVEESRTVVSDVLSDTNGHDSAHTESGDNADGQFSRQGSKGKGQITMTRPNRAFALRRARADGDEVPDTARTTSSVSSSGMSSRGNSMTNLSKSTTPSKPTTPQKVKRPLSGKYSDRQPDSSRSQASLGAQIVQKSRDNQNNSFTRTDGGRHSLRAARSLSIPSHQPATPTQSRTRKSDVTPSSTQLSHSRSLRVTGVGARERSSSVSKASSRNNSPKSAERNAWKRRKDYDPRKAVAEAKVKSKDNSRRKSRDMDTYLKNRGITRSASFTNAKDLKMSAYGSSHNDSTSSAHDYSRTSSEASDVFDEGPKRGFVPYSVRSVISSKVSGCSLDDEEAERYLRSSSALSSQEGSTSCPHSSSASSTTHKPLPLSVFKPSPSKHSQPNKSTRIVLKTPSPTPSSHEALSTHRRSVDSLVLYQSALRRKSDMTVRTSPRIPESYDTIIVSSIYQLSLKLRTCTDKTMDKLRDTDMIENGLDSPLDDLDSQSSASEIPAYKSANQELAGVLKNLRRIEQHIKIMNKVLFPEDEHSPDTTREKHEYMQEIERIRNELAGFHPIETPREDVWKQDTASIESDCEELSQADYY